MMKRRSFLALLGAVGAAAAAPMESLAAAPVASASPKPAWHDNMPDNGYYELPRGLLIQWGVSRTGDVLFHRAFHQCFQVAAMHEGEEDPRNFLMVEQISSTGVIIRESRRRGSSVLWVAIGSASPTHVEIRFEHGSRSLSI